MLGKGRRVIFSTYQSSGCISEAVSRTRLEQPDFALDLIIADEAHRTAGPGLNSDAGLFKTILDDSKVAARKRLFMTATPRQSKVSKGEVDVAAFSMGNLEIYGRRAITRSLSWAVDKGLLAPYRVFVAQVSDADVEAVLRADPELRVSGPTSVVAANATQIAAAIILAKSAKQRNLTSIVTYHSSIARAQRFQTILEHVVDSLPPEAKPAGQLTVSHINGLTPSDVRESRLATLDGAKRTAGDWAVVTNCNCLTEGVNVPSMDAIMMVDPRRSTVSIVQAVGRPMRKDPNRPDKVASILLPVFVGRNQEVQEAINEGAFSTVNDTIQALKDVDDALSEMFVQARMEHSAEPLGWPADAAASPQDEPSIAESSSPSLELEGMSLGGRLPLLRIADHAGHPLAGEAHDAVITVMTPEIGARPDPTGLVRHQNWHKTITLRILEDNTTRAERGLAALRVYVAKRGTSKVPAGYVVDDFRLGTWVVECRQKFRKGQLDEELKTELEILPGWVWRVMPALEEVMEDLSRHIAVTGHARVEGSYRSENGYGLGAWVSKRRMDYKNGKVPSDLAAELEKLPGWVWDVNEVERHKALVSLRSYFMETGTAKVPRGFFTEDGLALGKWVSLRRHRAKKGLIPAEQLAELDDIDTSWRAGALAPWESAPGAPQALHAKAS